MMQAVDTELSPGRERDLLLHLGACHACRETWDALTDATTLLPELHQMALQSAPEPEELWLRLRSQLPDAIGANHTTRPCLFQDIGLSRAMASPAQQAHGWVTFSLMGMGMLGALLFGWTAMGLSGAVASLGRFAGWVYAGMEGVGRLLGAVLGPNWLLVAEWGIPLIVGLLLYLGGRGFRRRLPDSALVFVHTTGEPVMREGRLGG